MKNILIVFITLIMGFIFSGCMATNPDEQTVPWGRPAEWESGSPYYGG